MQVPLKISSISDLFLPSSQPAASSAAALQQGPVGPAPAPNPIATATRAGNATDQVRTDVTDSAGMLGCFKQQHLQFVYVQSVIMPVRVVVHASQLTVRIAHKF